MGAIKGFFTGFTLTSTTLYLSLLLHQRHRARQSKQLQQQSHLLNTIVEPQTTPPEDTPRFALKRETWTEVWKDKWNAEIENAVRWAHTIRWDDIRVGAETRWKEWREGERRA